MSLRFEIDSSLAGERVDTALARLLGISRSSAADMCAQGDVKIGSKALSKSDRVNLADKLVVEPPEPTEPLRVVETPVDDLLIAYQDEDIVVVDKPAGVVAHPTVGF